MVVGFIDSVVVAMEADGAFSFFAASSVGACAPIRLRECCDSLAG